MARHVVRVAEPQDTEPSESGLSPVRTVLVVACDSAVGGEIVGALQHRGVAAMQGATAPQALYWARREPPTLLVLDARVQGWRRLSEEFRGKGRPVLVLTDDPKARTAALEGGCLDAPLFGLDVEALVLRIEILLGRGWVSETGRITAGPLVVDLSEHHLVWRGRRIACSQLLLRFAAYLAAHPGRIVPTRVLLEEVWGEPWADLNKVHQAVWRLRRLIGEAADSSFLVGKQRHGYALFPNAAPLPSRRSVAGF
jgi:DNA-binding response OmpR family regulator